MRLINTIGGVFLLFLGCLILYLSHWGSEESEIQTLLTEKDDSFGSALKAILGLMAGVAFGLLGIIMILTAMVGDLVVSM
jgi:hypothetical protein